MLSATPPRHPLSILTTHAPGCPALPRPHQSQFPLLPAPFPTGCCFSWAGCCCESERHVRLCYVITRHARGNMAAAGVVSGKVSNGTGWRGCPWPVACGCWTVAAGEAGRVGVGGRRWLTATGLGGVSAVPPECWVSPV